MSSAAHLKSIDALRELRARLIDFQTGAASALDSIHQQVGRCQSWLDHDRPLFWKNEVLRGSDRVAEARVALAQCRLRRIDGEPPSCFDEQKQLESARRRLAVAEQKVEEVKRWRREVGHEALEMTGRTGQLQDTVQADLPQAIAALERIIGAAEGYLNLQHADSGTTEKREPKRPSN